MKTSLVAISNTFQTTIQQTIMDLGLHHMIQKNEKMDIFGSIKYGLALEGESDVDIWISCKKPRESLIQKIEYFSQYIVKNKLFKKTTINNFFDNYPVFETKKDRIINPSSNSKFFLLELSYYLDDSLDKKINFQIHIAENDFIEPFPQLLQLSLKQRENLLFLKKNIYKKLPFFWNRSYLLYTGFLAGHTTEKAMTKYLLDNGYKKLIKK